MAFLKSLIMENRCNLMDENTCIRLINSPIGTLFIRGNAEAVTAVGFDDNKVYTAEGELTAPVECCMRQLSDYFDGKRTEFNVPLYLDGTEFRIRVWTELRNIPFAHTQSYTFVANQIGIPKGQRAVGNANNHNPIMILIPCHRIIGADGRLVGYAGGLWRKEWLLEHERRVLGLT